MPKKWLPRAAIPLILLLILTVRFGRGQTSDWPMSRFDPRRSGASPQKLAASLHLQWMRELPALQPAWPDQTKMQFDSAYDPIVLGRTLFLASPRHDCVFALDVASGAEKWRFFAEGPIR